jgi:hypothetical protein
MGIRHRCNVVRPRNACVPMPSGRLKPARTVLVAGEDHSQDGRIAFPPWPPAFLKASARLLFMYRQRGAGVVELWQWQSSEPNAIVVDAQVMIPGLAAWSCWPRIASQRKGTGTLLDGKKSGVGRP